MTGRDKARIALYGMGGIYLLLLVYQMYEGLSTAGEDKLLMMIFMGVFTVAGLLMVTLGVKTTYTNAKKAKEDARKVEEDNK